MIHAGVPPAQVDFLARWWPIPYAAAFAYAPLGIDNIWTFRADSYYLPLFPLATLACIYLSLHPYSNTARHVAVVISVAAAISRSLSILVGTYLSGAPIAGLAGVVWLLIAYSFCGLSVFSWMHLQVRKGA